MEEKKNKATGLLISIGFHALIVFLLFILPGFKSDSVFGGEGIEVALGSDIEGGNSGTMADLGSQEATPPPPEQASGDNLETDAVTDDNSESNIVVPKKDKKVTSPQKKITQKTTTTTKEVAKTPEKRTDQSALFTKKKGSNNGNEGGDPNSTGYGGPKDGNRGRDDGDPKGNPDASGGSGGYDINKPGSHLRGRGSPRIPTDSKFEDVGKLVFEITVNRSGTGIKIKKIAPSSINNYNQIERAKSQVKALNFGVKPDADEEQVGYYTIIYERR